jgi:hypothetical protein
MKLPSKADRAAVDAGARPGRYISRLANASTRRIRGGTVRTRGTAGVAGVIFSGAIVATLALAACSRPGEGPSVDVAATAAVGSTAERHWQWFVTNVRSWAPEYRVGLVPRTADNGPRALAAGRSGVAHASLAEAADVLPELALLELPLLFDSDAEADHVLDRHLLPEIRRRLDAHGLALLAWTEGEPRVAYVTGATFDGATLAPLAMHVEGTATAPAGSRALLHDGGHVPGLVLASNAWFEPLSPHDEDVFRMAYATLDARSDTRRETAAVLARLERDPKRAVGVPSADERARWRGELAAERERRAGEFGAAGTSLLALVERGRAEFVARGAAR